MSAHVETAANVGDPAEFTISLGSLSRVGPLARVPEGEPEQKTTGTFAKVLLVLFFGQVASKDITPSDTLTDELAPPELDAMVESVADDVLGKIWGGPSETVNLPALIELVDYIVTRGALLHPGMWPAICLRAALIPELLNKLRSVLAVAIEQTIPLTSWDVSHLHL